MRDSLPIQLYGRIGNGLFASHEKGSKVLFRGCAIMDGGTYTDAHGIPGGEALAEVVASRGRVHGKIGAAYAEGAPGGRYR